MEARKPYYGQLVIGPPGSGKTTYCYHAAEMLKNVFNRKLVIVNLDPANDNLPYQPDINVQESVSVVDVMELENLGPNGALMFAIEQLERDIEWLFTKIGDYGPEYYFIFDCPGQVELYTHHKSFMRISEALIKKFDFRLAALFLADSYYCSDPALFISVVLTALSTMIRISLPHVNVLSKIDLIQKLGKLDFDLRYYTELTDMSRLVTKLTLEPFWKKYSKLTNAIAGIVEDYSLVSFLPVSVKDPETLYHVIKTLDKCTGYSKSDLEERQVRQVMSNLPTMGPDFDYSMICNIQEKYISADEHVFDSD